MSKLSSAEEAVKQIKDGDTVAFNGFAFGFGFAEEIAKALGKRYEEEGHPKEFDAPVWNRAAETEESLKRISALTIWQKREWSNESLPGMWDWQRS